MLPAPPPLQNRVRRPCNMAPRRTESSNCFPYLNHIAPIDVDLHVPSNCNLHYFTTHDFHDDFEITECLKEKQCFAACIVITGVCKSI